MSDYRRLLSGVVSLAILVVAAISVNYRRVEAQNPNPGSAPVSIVSPLPLPVTNSVVRQPFFEGLETAPFVVPSDQQLTIEFVTAKCHSGTVSSDAVVISLSVTRPGVFFPAHHYFAPKFTLNPSPGVGNIYVSTDVTRIYAPPGSTLDLVRWTSGYVCDMSLDGYTTPG